MSIVFVRVYMYNVLYVCMEGERERERENEEVKEYCVCIPIHCTGVPLETSNIGMNVVKLRGDTVIILPNQHFLLCPLFCCAMN